MSTNADKEDREFIEQLREVRKLRGLSVAEVASIVDVPESTLNRVELGEEKLPFDLGLKLSNYFDLPYSKVNTVITNESSGLKSSNSGIVTIGSSRDIIDTNGNVYIGHSIFNNTYLTKRVRGNKVFISYSRQDISYLERLLVHLSPLERQGVIEIWVDKRIDVGDQWEYEIEEGLKNSRAAILLVSADFLASDFIVTNELPNLLEQAKEAGTRVIPIILKPCRFLRDKKLTKFQAINRARPLGFMSEIEQESIYDSVAIAIEKLFEEQVLES